MKSPTKLFSEVKMARFERKHLVNHSKFHRITCKRFNKADRKASKVQLKKLVIN